MKDPTAKNITVSVKVSLSENARLRALAKGGSAGKGMRRLIDNYLAGRRIQDEAWERAKEEQE
jgi:hypothetical protein